MLPIWLLYGLALSWLLVCFATAWIVLKRWQKTPDVLFLCSAFFLVVAGVIGVYATLAWPNLWLVSATVIALMVCVLVHFSVHASKKLQTLIAFTLFVSMVLTIGIPASSVYLTTRKQTRTNANLSQFLTSQKILLDNQLKQLVDLSQTLSQTAPDLHSDTLATLSNNLNHTLIASRLTSLLVTDSEGKVLIRAENPNQTGDLFLQSVDWGNTIVSSQTGLSGIIYDPSHTPRLMAATPFLVNGQVAGYYILQSALDQDFLQTNPTAYSLGLADQTRPLVYQANSGLPAWLWTNPSLAKALASSTPAYFTVGSTTYCLSQLSLPTLSNYPLEFISIAPIS